METNSEYTCPYCRWRKSHTSSKVREEEELINREYLGEDFNKTYYLDTKKKFLVRICDTCHKALKVRTAIIMTLIGIMTVCGCIAIVMSLIDRFFDVEAIREPGGKFILVAIGSGILTFVFWLGWKIFGGSRAHVRFERAKNCNALERFKD